MFHFWINQVVGFTGKMFEKHLWQSKDGLTLGAIISFFIYSSCESLCLLVAIHEKEPQNPI